MKQLLLSVAAAFILFAAHAQSDVLVQVYDLGSADVVPGITVTVQNEQTAITKEGITDEQGNIRIRLNSSGTYTISIKENEKWILVEGATVNIRANEEASVSNLVYEPSNVKLAEAEVASQRSSVTQINTRNAEVASELSAQEISQIPIEIGRASWRERV